MFSFLVLLPVWFFDFQCVCRRLVSNELKSWLAFRSGVLVDEPGASFPFSDHTWWKIKHSRSLERVLPGWTEDLLYC